MDKTAHTKTLREKIECVPPENVAAIDSKGNSITYGELLDRAKELSKNIGPARKLVSLQSENSVNWLVAYIACLIGNHPVIISSSGSKNKPNNIVSNFSVDVSLCPENAFFPIFHPSPKDKKFHTELAVLLSTSGSTGSAKCVKLSHANLYENAKSICEYLNIGPSDNGCANLPTHYSYGLSIVNSHLACGATVLLTSLSVLDCEFWDFITTNKATSFAGVPHTYDLLERIDFKEKAPQSLKYFTQAGGKMDPEKVQHFNRVAKRNQWNFFVMYGQTEATARMSYMPPHILNSHASSIGIPIPGGSFSIINQSGSECSTGEVGELVYEGPNVMMGYASGVDSLNTDPIPQKLATGDFASVDKNGLYYIKGRKSRFIKIFGKRIGLDEIERLFKEANIDVVATGVDEHLLISTTQSHKQNAIYRLIQKHIDIPKTHFSIHIMDDFPRTTTGKIDYQSLNKLIPSTTKNKYTKSINWIFFRKKEKKTFEITEVFLETFGEKFLDENATFRSLGGDSLTYIRVSNAIENRIGYLPHKWDTIPISDLRRLSQEGDIQKTNTNPANVYNFDTLRGLACLLVVFYHVVGDPTSGLKLEDGFLRWLVDSLDYFRMPIFMAMAGFFYATASVDKSNVVNFLKTNFSKLVIPVVFITCIYWWGRRIAYGLDEQLLPLLSTGYLHLWFIYALLNTLIIAAAIDCIAKKNTWIWIGLAFTSPIIALKTPHIEFVSISLTLQYLCFFSFGVLVNRHKEILESKSLIIVALAIAISSITLHQLKISGSEHPLLDWPYLWFIGGGSCLVVMMSLFPRISILESVGIFSYSIYLWHPLVNGVIRNLLEKLGVEGLFPLVLLGFITAVLIPIAVYLIANKFPTFIRTPIIGR